jgi:hypothetical protein
MKQVSDGPPWQPFRAPGTWRLTSFVIDGTPISPVVAVHGPIMHDDSYIKQVAGVVIYIKDYFTRPCSAGRPLNRSRRRLP